MLPYLQTKLEGAEYNAARQLLVWPDNDNKVRFAFRPREIKMALIDDRERGETLVRNMVNRVNEIWEQRQNIVPDYTEKAELSKVMDIFMKLPRSNCRECGYPTCMAFAVAAREDRSLLALCAYTEAKEVV